MQQNLVVIVSLVLTEFIKEFSPLKYAVTQHIQHQYMCEWQIGAQCHLMDGDSPRERLEPQAEDWHCLVCVLSKLMGHKFSMYIKTYVLADHLEISIWSHFT